jgi:methanogenic corrinoid protein MtbC1
LTEIENQLQRLSKAVLEGNAVEARQSTYASLARGSTVNEVLEAILDSVDILVGLYEVGEYDQSRILAAETAVNSSLEVMKDYLVKAENRFNLKATVGPIGIKGGALLALAFSAALRSLGFHTQSLSKTQTPLEILRNSEELKADVVFPILSSDGIERQLQIFAEEIERGGFKSKFQVIAIAPGFQGTWKQDISVARNSGEALSRATEWALKRNSARGE